MSGTERAPHQSRPIRVPRKPETQFQTTGRETGAYSQDDGHRQRNPGVESEDGGKRFGNLQDTCNQWWRQ